MASRVPGVIMVDVAAFADASDRRLWSIDRLHGNSAGHEVVAHALAHGLGLTGFDESWRAPMPPAPPLPLVGSVQSDVAWLHQHALPWLWRTVRGRSAGDGLGPKRPIPVPVTLTP